MLALLASTPAGAEPTNELDRWVPSLSAFSGVLGQPAEASVFTEDTGTLTGPEPLRPPVDGSDTLWSPFVGGNFELMTPGWRALPGSPRLFARGGLAATFGFNRDVAKEGSPGELEFPNLRFGAPRCDLDERQVPGQGSSTSAKVRSLEISAGGGVAFSFNVGERLVRVKPSFEYHRTEIDLTGKARRATVFIPCFDPGPPAVPQTLFRFITIDAEDDLVVDGIGGGLEVEADAGRAGPFILSLYISGQFYNVISDRDVTFIGTFSDPLGDEMATFDFEVDPWYYRGGVGLRFRFVPEDGDWWPFR